MLLQTQSSYSRISKKSSTSKAGFLSSRGFKTFLSVFGAFGLNTSCVIGGCHCDRYTDIHWVWKQSPFVLIKLRDGRPGASVVNAMYSAHRACVKCHPLSKPSSPFMFSTHSVSRILRLASLLRAEGSECFCEWWSQNTHLYSGISPVFRRHWWKGCRGKAVALRHKYTNLCSCPPLHTTSLQNASATHPHMGHSAEKLW